MIQSIDFQLDAYLAGGAAVFALMTAMWLVSLARRDAGVADPTWPILFLAAAIVFALRQDATGPRTILLLSLVALWSLRLGGYLAWRNLHEGEEDHRYQAMRRNQNPGFWWKSLGTVFWLQAFLAWFIALPLLAGTGGDPDAALGWLDALGVALWLVGMVFEAGGDWQLARFKADPSTRGQVLDRGLWRYTRHPNYFGDFCVWWGFYAIAVAAGGWWTVPGPLLMSVLLMKVSGVTLTESTIEERRPAYAEYKRRTNAFFPGPRGDA
ncbi:MAG: DUF1295 domain-containing protein [Acidobacteriota bacterium]